ncbi:sn-glycerol-3-phosphate ABC transporter permease UgpA [Carnimonas bestiolae]|uniref:sn-glycerol-3-phosphate ABC transporter permease UgpA n=1 Tax=Carnimonas bestiolae TaxID=3402172 RepID=UPI003EDC8246
MATFQRHRITPWLLLAPQLAVVAVFFFWPAVQGLYQSLFAQDAFGLGSEFVGLQNFIDVLEDSEFLNSLLITVVFTLAVAVLSLGIALLLAVQADRVIRGARFYRTLLIWPYAVAPAVAAVLWNFMFDPSLGVISHALEWLGIHWDHRVNGHQALLLVIIACVWVQVSYNLVFFLAGLQAIPQSLLEAATIDAAGPWRRFWSVTFPLLSPTAFFLLVTNTTYAFFETFGAIDATTQGGPGGSTRTLIYKIFQDGFVGLDFGHSAAQSVMLMLVVGLLTLIQFRYIERKVHY